MESAALCEFVKSLTRRAMAPPVLFARPAVRTEIASAVEGDGPAGGPPGRWTVTQ